LRLDFAELYWNAAGKRVFNVAINGSAALTNFDVFKTAGAEFKAVAKSFSPVADSSGNITITFTPTKDNATVGGIELSPPGTTGTPDPGSPCWTNASPIPVGYGLVGHPTGPSYAKDPFHVDWDAFCSSNSSHCDSNGNPHYVSSDSDMIANTLPSSFYGAGVTTICNGAQVVAGDQNCQKQVGVYYASTNDPLVQINATNSGYGPSGNSGSLNGSSIYIPKNAIAELPGDGHMSIHQPSGVVCQLYQVPSQPVTGTSLSVGSGACAVQSLTNEGTFYYFGNYAGYASQEEMSRGMIRAEDLVGSNGDGTDALNPQNFTHGVYGSFENNQSGTVWPALYGDGRCTLSQNNGAMPVEGMFLYLDKAGYQVVSNWSPPAYLRPLKRFLGTLHKHGMLDMDSTGCGTSNYYVNTLTWGPQAAYQASGSSLFDAYLQNVIRPNDAAYAPNGSDGAVYLVESGEAYVFALLYYQDVPGLSPANFHWLNLGCGQTAVQGSSSNPC
jgi:hypothetical protein